MESNDSPEIPDRGETSDIPGLPSQATMETIFAHFPLFQADLFLCVGSPLKCWALTCMLSAGVVHDMGCGSLGAKQSKVKNLTGLYNPE